MGETSPTSSRIGFGHFEVDLAAGQLYRNGRLVRLPEQPFQVLVVLLERPGQVVTREELRDKLWAGQTFVDFDQGLNNAINKLRDALGDSAANPRFIETLPRRGYRFVYPLTEGKLGNSVTSEAADTALSGPTHLTGWKSWLPWVLFGVTAISLLFVLAFSRHDVSRPTPLRRFSLRPRAAVQSFTFNTNVSLSANGKYIAFVGGPNRELWIQDLALEEPRAVVNSAGSNGPFWSADSEFLLFSQGGEIRKVHLGGGPSSPICKHEARIYGGTVSPDGKTVVFSAGTAPILYAAPFNGGEAQPVFSDAERHDMYAAYTNGATASITDPRFLPASAGPRVLLFGLGFPNTRVQRMMIQDLDTGRRVTLGPGVEAVYSPTGHLLYQKGTDLWAITFSIDTMEPRGEPFLVKAESRGPTVASDGTLVFLDRTVPEVPEGQLVWHDRDGQKLDAVGEPFPIPWGSAPIRLSPDGSKVILTSDEGTAGEIWIHDLKRNLRTRLTSDPAYDYTHAWSPDGKQIAFSSNRDGDYDIFLTGHDGTGELMKLAANPVREVVNDWSLDGKHILYRTNPTASGADLWYLQRGDDGGWISHPYLQSDFAKLNGRFSPDGLFVAYQSDESGRPEVYVRRFPDNGRKSLVSNRGGENPRWRRDGKELFYTQGNMLIAVPFSAEREQPIGQPEQLFEHPVFLTRMWDVSADGKRFLLAEQVGETPEPQIRVVLNWFEEFRERN